MRNEKYAILYFTFLANFQTNIHDFLKYLMETTGQFKQYRMSFFAHYLKTS